MIRIVLASLALFVVPALVHAQDVAPLQSLRPTQGACTLGSQSLRVCNNAFTSCNDVCAARALEPSADVAGCTTACCIQFNVCLQQRGCRSRVIDCN